MMLQLQAQGCHNINLVTPSHVVAQIIAAVHLAAQQGLRLPLVYNTGGYDSPQALELLDGVIDIYMPDMKYGDSRLAHRYSHVRDYVDVNRAAVKQMHRQVGDLRLDLVYDPIYTIPVLDISIGAGFPVLQGQLSVSLELNKQQVNSPHIFGYPADFVSEEEARVDDLRTRLGLGWSRVF